MRGSSPLSDRQRPMPRQLSPPLSGPRSPRPSPEREAFLRRFRGRCFRCLSKDRRRSACRDPPRCINCWAWGHESSRCPTSRPAPATSPRRPPIHQRLRFPAPPPSAAMISRAIPLPAPRRPGFKHSVVMASRAIERQIFTLRTRATRPHPSPSARPLKLSCASPRHPPLPGGLLRPLRRPGEPRPRHHLGRITVDGASFLLLP